jgi:hypothetical protein
MVRLAQAAEGFRDRQELRPSYDFSHALRIG